MITLVRPNSSKHADEIENRLQEMKTGYDVVNKEQEDSLFLIESGEVVIEEKIGAHLDAYEADLKTRRFNPSDSREIG